MDISDRIGTIVQGKKKRQYTAEFKQQAVKLWETTEKSQAEVERELGISQGLVAKWKRKQKQGVKRFGRTNLVDQSEAERELAQLRREVAVLQQEREILKKATNGTFALSSAAQTDEIRVYRQPSRRIRGECDVSSARSVTQRVL